MSRYNEPGTWTHNPTESDEVHRSGAAGNWPILAAD